MAVSAGRIGETSGRAVIWCGQVGGRGHSHHGRGHGHLALAAAIRPRDRPVSPASCKVSRFVQKSEARVAWHPYEAGLSWHCPSNLMRGRLKGREKPSEAASWRHTEPPTNAGIIGGESATRQGGHDRVHPLVRTKSLHGLMFRQCGQRTRPWPPLGRLLSPGHADPCAEDACARSQSPAPRPETVMVVVTSSPIRRALPAIAFSSVRTPYRAPGTARTIASLQVSLRVSTAVLRQASRRPSRISTVSHCCLMWALQAESTSRSFARESRHASEISLTWFLKQPRRGSSPVPADPPQSDLASAMQAPTAKVSCAAKLADNSMKAAPVATTIRIEHIGLLPIVEAARCLAEDQGERGRSSPA
jgi:hypothetical protein